MNTRTLLLWPALAVLLACTDATGPTSRGGASLPRTVAAVDTTCDLASYPSPEWALCEAENWARSGEATLEQLAPAFVQRALEQQAANLAALTARNLADPSWGLPPALGNTPATPLCAAGMGPCVGDPFRYPGVDGADGDNFYEAEAEVLPVVYYDRECARISGRVWRPRGVSGRLPAVVIKNGSVQAGEALYWWAAQALVRAGYMVLTGDPRGQGRSDFATPGAGQGGNINGAVFFEGLVDDIDFLLSSEAQPYPHEQACAGTYPTQTAAFNPFAAQLDAGRIGVVGHSYGRRRGHLGAKLRRARLRALAGAAQCQQPRAGHRGLGRAGLQPGARQCHGHQPGRVLLAAVPAAGVAHGRAAGGAPRAGPGL